MISMLTGHISHKSSKYIIIDVSGVGYKVFTTTDNILNIGKNSKDKITLWTYLAVRENAMDLYGFSSVSELNFFELLITISGIGPKTALGILNIASIESIEKAVQNNDAVYLTKMSGIGKKVVEKIVMELKDKITISSHNPENEKIMKNDSDALEALKSLGYRENESREALKKIAKNNIDTSAKVKEALKILGK